MPVTDVVKDLDAFTLTVHAEFAAPPDRVWRAWTEPRLFERWWGPPGYPATVTEHELHPGGTVRYFMTGPDGEQFHGYWTVVNVDPPNGFEIKDGFANADGTPNKDLPEATMVVAITAAEDGTTRLRSVTTYASREALEKVLAMGMEEGLRAATGQLDDLLAEGVAG